MMAYLQRRQILARRYAHYQAQRKESTKRHINKSVSLYSIGWRRTIYEKQKSISIRAPAWPMGISIKMNSHDLRKVILKEWNKKKEEQRKMQCMNTSFLDKFYMQRTVQNLSNNWSKAVAIKKMSNVLIEDRVQENGWLKWT
ncbi:uncharacterized protein LOC126802234 isoform X2 [Argentina anserina]|uniref:uncharacterized protein LOC126802234 isoform X2 n=1 Tax=Argentina anserina TaxID=57926 RepID=UPI0021763E1E|nr:uncharacterized protein LOC126802234 isoform X2 [Potentilla anserina]